MSQNAEVPARNGEISDSFNRLKVSIEYAEKSAQSLGARIESILSQCPPNVETGGKAPTPMVPHAKMLIDMAIRIEKIAKYLDGICKRVEL